jgi:cytochrome c peroxidase
VLALALSAPVLGQEGGVIVNPTVPRELPVEVETELAPAGSLKQAPLWKELVQLLEDPYSAPVRRRSFLPPGCSYAVGASLPCDDALMPELNVYPLDYAPLIGQTLRLRTSDGEISWDQPGPLFDPDEVVEVDANNTPLELRTIIGELFIDDEDNLVVSNPDDDLRIPPDGTIVAVPAVVDGVLFAFDEESGELEEVVELETPISEVDFFRVATDNQGVPGPLQAFAKGRPAAEVLGKALFWDMQVGSDGVQACGTCHFNAGVDNRTRNQLNPDHLGGDLALDFNGPNEEIEAADFPFHGLADPELPGEDLVNPDNVTRDSNDVMSSMGVKFTLFADIPAPGAGAFAPAFNGVRALLPDLGTPAPDPIPAFVDPGTNANLRRVEPRNTPTMHSAAFNFDNFWDGRARFHFNGGSVFGPSDPAFHLFVDPGTPGPGGGPLQGTTNGLVRPDLLEEDPDVAAQPVRIKFSSLASQAVGPPLSDFEMSFSGRSWAKIGKKLLQGGARSTNSVTPLANQLVSTTDSVLGPWSNQGGSNCVSLGRTTAVNRPGLCVSYVELILLAYPHRYWHNNGQHLNIVADATDPFDGVRLQVAPGAANPNNRQQVNQMEANFAFFFGMAVQAYEQLLIPDDTPFDRFMDANPLAANGVGQPGEQGTLPPDRIPGLVGEITLVEGFGEDELFGFDIFSGANLTAALEVGSARNPEGVGSNPFLRTGRCMLCHLGPEQTDHTSNVNHGILISDAEFELPPPGEPEPTGPFRTISGLMLEEEVEEPAQDGVEVENRNMVLVDDPGTAWHEGQVGEPNGIAFGDNGIYNIGVRPTGEDGGRGDDDPFGWPLSLSALAMKNLAGPGFEPCDDAGDAPCAMPNFDPSFGLGGGLFEQTGGGLPYPGTSLTLQSINPGLVMEPLDPLMPAYMAPWLNNMPAGELHPEVDELAFAPNTLTPDTPFAEYGEILFGSDLHCGTFDPTVFGNVAPNFGWGPSCPNTQSAIPNNFESPLNGSTPFENRVGRNGAFKAPQLRNVALTGPYFHTGSYLTLRQVVDFYMRGGDFPVTNAEDRDPNLVDVSLQAFGFGTTIGLPAQFQDGLPDLISQYGVMPDTTATTPEYATNEDATESLVKFLLALTDGRVEQEQGPFDRPEIFVPVDGRAGTNAGGRAALLADPMFLHVEAVGGEGHAEPLEGFLGISNTPIPGDGNDHFDRF